MRRRAIASSLLFIAILVVGVSRSNAQQGIGAEYQFNAPAGCSTPWGGIASKSAKFGMVARVDGMPSFVQEVPVSYVSTGTLANATISIPADRHEIAFSVLDSQFILSSPVTMSGSANLGLEGSVSFSVTLSTFEPDFPSFAVPLQPDLEFETSEVPMRVSFTGTATIDDVATVLNASMQPLPMYAWGRFVAAPDLSNGELSLHFGIDTLLTKVSRIVRGHQLDLYVVAVLGVRGCESATTFSVADNDADGIADIVDNCPEVANPEQADADSDRIGNACNDAIDQDGDDYADALDNCPSFVNFDQADADADTIGDVCDPLPNDPYNSPSCSAELAVCNAALLSCFNATDVDGDAEQDRTDACLETSASEPIDSAGCSQAQFCATVDVTISTNRRVCRKLDWRNDEPATNPRDCAINTGTDRGTADDTCVPAPE